MSARTKSPELTCTLRLEHIPEFQMMRYGMGVFRVWVGETEVTVVIQPRWFKKIRETAEEAKARGQSWMALIEGFLGPRTERGFVLDRPLIETSIRRAKAK